MSDRDNPDAMHLGFLSVDVVHRAHRRIKALEAAIRKHRRSCLVPEMASDADRQLWAISERDPCKRKTVYKRSEPRGASDPSS